LISIRKEIQESENSEARAKALLKAFLSLVTALPKAALPANPELSTQCKENLEQAATPLKTEPLVPAIDEAGKVALQQFDEIYRSNKFAVEERDAALKEVVETVEGAISSFRSHGERHKTNLTKLADRFEVLSAVDDINEVRRRLRDDVFVLRETVEEMRRENEESAKRLETQVTAFQERVEQARKESGVDRLTGLGNRRDAEKHLLKASKREGPVCMLLFDIDGFREINRQHGTLFGDKLLQALAHRLRDRFPGENILFRWGADEFLVLTEGSLTVRLEQSRGICESFAGGSYFVAESGLRKPVAASVACGGALYQRGESVDEWYRRSRATLEQSWKGTRR